MSGIGGPRAGLEGRAFGAGSESLTEGAREGGMIGSGPAPHDPPPRPGLASGPEVAGGRRRSKDGSKAAPAAGTSLASSELVGVPSWSRPEGRPSLTSDL